MENEICGDNRFEIIAKYKQALINATNIESRPEEMAVLDSVLFRFWQMGWLEHWISVEDYTNDELPPLIDKNNHYGESAQVLFVVVLDGVQYINKGTFDYDTGVWHSLDMQCSFCKEDVTHWMPMPQAPILSNIEKNGKNQKGGEK